MNVLSEPQTAFVISHEDNVATALEALEPGEIRLLGEGSAARITVTESVPKGHKLALRNIREGESVIKYGIPIGHATQDIAQGTWVHLHVMKSNYDERSDHLDVHSGAPKDTLYE